jgi:hypothetical protein
MPMRTSHPTVDSARLPRSEMDRGFDRDTVELLDGRLGATICERSFEPASRAAQEPRTIRSPVARFASTAADDAASV